MTFIGNISNAMMLKKLQLETIKGSKLLWFCCSFNCIQLKYFGSTWNSLSKYIYYMYSVFIHKL